MRDCGGHSTLCEESLVLNQKQDGARFSRRSLIAGASTLPFTYALARRLCAEDVDISPHLVVREREPQNLESDFSALAAITPNDQFYVRNHFAVPTLDAKSWNLQIEGAVANRLQLTFDELIQMPSETRPVTLECAGNGRVLLVPKVDGAQWQLGAVSTAEWTGVRLDAVLECGGSRSESDGTRVRGSRFGRAVEAIKAKQADQVQSQHSFGKGPRRRCAPGLQNERPAVAAGSWVSNPGNRTGLVRNGFCEMALRESWP